jgi:lysophospholipase L1-like esterase
MKINKEKSKEAGSSMSNEQVRWLLKVIQPERTLAFLPGGDSLGPSAHAGLLGIPEEVYTTELDRMKKEAAEAADELLADQAVASMVDLLPLRAGAKAVAFGDSLTSDSQSWAVILREMLAKRRGNDGISLTINAVGGETTTHALVRIADTIESQPDWIIFLFGTNDARMQGPHPTKTLVHHEETARNIAELRQRVSNETAATCIWITPPAVDEAMVAAHWGLARFGVRFRNQDLERVAKIVRESDGSVIDAFSTLGSPPASDLLMGDGLHFTLAGQKRMALEVIRAWSNLK